MGDWWTREPVSHLEATWNAVPAGSGPVLLIQCWESNQIIKASWNLDLGLWYGTAIYKNVLFYKTHEHFVSRLRGPIFSSSVFQNIFIYWLPVLCEDGKMAEVIMIIIWLGVTTTGNMPGPLLCHLTLSYVWWWHCYVNFTHKKKY